MSLLNLPLQCNIKQFLSHNEEDLILCCCCSCASCKQLCNGKHPAGVGALYTGMTSGECVTSNTLGNKVGVSSATNVLGLVAVGDAGIEAAAKQAGIKRFLT